MSFPNKILPILQCRYTEEYNKEKENEPPKLLKHKSRKNFKSVELGKINSVDKIMKTLKLKILNRDKNIFNSPKGNINMIIEE